MLNGLMQEVGFPAACTAREDVSAFGTGCGFGLVELGEGGEGYGADEGGGCGHDAEFEKHFFGEAVDLCWVGGFEVEAVDCADVLGFDGFLWAF